MSQNWKYLNIIISIQIIWIIFSSQWNPNLKFSFCVPMLVNNLSVNYLQSRLISALFSNLLLTKETSIGGFTVLLLAKHMQQTRHFSSKIKVLLVIFISQLQMTLKLTYFITFYEASYFPFCFWIQMLKHCTLS